MQKMDFKIHYITLHRCSTEVSERIGREEGVVAQAQISGKL